MMRRSGLHLVPSSQLREAERAMRGTRQIVTTAQDLPDDDRARIEAMLRTMARHASEAITDEAFVKFARRVTSDNGRSTTPERRARLALAYTQSLRYVWDPVGVERLQTPQATIALGAGDCNSLTSLLGALLAAVGVGSRFCAIKERIDDPEWSHVYLEVRLGDFYAAADPSPMGQGKRAVYLALGRAPIIPVSPIRLAATEPGAPIQGLWDSIGDVFEGLRDFTVNIITAKYFRKGLAWSWGHMGADMRQLVATVGPMVANFYAPGFGGTLSKAAIGLLEKGRLTKAQKKAAKKALLEAQKSGVIPAGLDVQDGKVLEAIWLAGNMPAAEEAKWRAERGLAPKPAAPRPSTNKARRIKRLAPAAAIFALPMLLA